MCARRAEKFRGLCNFFAGVGRKICVIPTLDAFFFGYECNADSIKSQRRCEVCAANACGGHVICVQETCRISGNFAKFSRDFCAKFASSRRWSRASSCIRTHTDLERSCNEILRFKQQRWPSSRNFCARSAPKFFGKFPIFSRELGAKFA